MTDRDELIASFEGRIWGGEMHKGGYIHVPQEEAEAILELLKGQEPLVIRKEIEDEIYDYIANCPECGMAWAMCRREKMRFCPGCGRAVKWDDSD